MTNWIPISREVLSDNTFRPGHFAALLADGLTEAARFAALPQEEQDRILAERDAEAFAKRRTRFSDRCWIKRHGKSSVLKDMATFHECDPW